MVYPPGFIRQASATAVLVSIDPELNPICGQPSSRWLDTVGTQVQYLGPDKFVDFMQIDWNTKMVEYNVTMKYWYTLMIILPSFHVLRHY